MWNLYTKIRTEFKGKVTLNYKGLLFLGVSSVIKIKFCDWK
jgi:hypothetical protein